MWFSTPRKQFSHSSVHQNDLKFLSHRLVGPTSRISDSVGLDQGQKICIVNKFLGNANDMGHNLNNTTLSDNKAQPNPQPMVKPTDPLSLIKSRRLNQVTTGQLSSNNGIYFLHCGQGSFQSLNCVFWKCFSFLIWIQNMLYYHRISFIL